MNPFPVEASLSPLWAFGLGAAVSVLMMVATWLVQLRTGNAGIVDVIWAFTVVVPAAFVAAGSVTQNAWLGPTVMVAAILLWSTRLAAHLHHRYRPEVEDPRYAALRKEWGDQANFRMLRFYLAQCMGSLLLALPLCVIATAGAQPVWIPLVFGALVVSSVALEAIADLQLARFKILNPRGGAICNTGLWAWTRHPNYFFEWTVWVFFALWALVAGSFPLSLLGLIAPVMMYHFLVNVTGVRPTDEHMARSRPEAFAAYARTTPAFFPRPPRR